MTAACDDKAAAPAIELQDCRACTDDAIVEVLQTCFQNRWGTVEWWRWKHRSRPGFDSRHIQVFLDNGRPVACFHAGILPVKIAPGLEVLCSFEGDYAVLPECRGRGLLERAFHEMGACLASDGVLLRIGFTSGELSKRVYQKKLGHTFVPVTTAQYWKILSAPLLCERLQAYGEKIRTQRWMQYILRGRELQIELRVDGFEPCYLTLARDVATCSATAVTRPDLRISIPYPLLTCLRNGAWRGCRTLLSSLFTGRIRVSAIPRFVWRLVHAT